MIDTRNTTSLDTLLDEDLRYWVAHHRCDGIKHSRKIDRVLHETRRILQLWNGGLSRAQSDTAYIENLSFLLPIYSLGDEGDGWAMGLD